MQRPTFDRLVLLFSAIKYQMNHLRIRRICKNFMLQLQIFQSYATMFNKKIGVNFKPEVTVSQKMCIIIVQ